MVKSAQRVYSGAALEAWLPRVMEPWEAAFPAEVLDAGREIYRSGEVRSMELTGDLVIVSVKRGKSETYAMVEWADGPRYRSSTDDRLIGGALAVAGLYEVEELVADEIDPISDEPEKKRQRSSEGGGEAAAQDGLQGFRGEHPHGSENKEKAPPGSGEAAHPGNPRVISVHLDPVAQGIRLQAFWKNGAEADKSAFVEPARDRMERERFIRLTGAARRANFRYREGARDYILEDLSRIPGFVNRDLPRWRAFFDVVADPAVLRLGEGVREARPEISIREGGVRMFVRIDFHLDGMALADGAAGALASSRGEVLLLPEVGLVRIAAETRGALETWLDSTGRRLEHELPRYMVFSFLGRSEIGVKLSSAIETWRRGIEAVEDAPLKLPDMLRSYQRASVSWMRRLLAMGCHTLLADEMGLGKTLQILALLDQMWERDAPVIVVCPASVIPVWEGEIARFFPGFRTECLRRDSDVVSSPGDRLWLASYSQLRRRRKDLEAVRWSFAILDEAQFIKNPDAKVTQACFALDAQYRIAMTGTPVENRHLDLWTIFRFLMPGLLGSRRRLESAIASSPEEETRHLVRQISPFMLRRTKREVARELPGKVEVPLYCPLTEPQQRLYRQLVDRGTQTYTGRFAENLRKHRMGVLSLLTRLRQVCCDPSLVPASRVERGHSGKLHSLLPKLTEVVGAGSKVVIFSQFVGFLERTRGAIEEAMPGVPLYELTGRTRDRQAPVEQFQNSDQPAIILVSLRAGGVGITLHSADYVFLMDPWWNPAVEAQAVDRVHRIGQKQTVFIYRMISRGTVEEKMEELKNHKRTVFDQLVSAPGEASWADLDNHFESLQALVGYRPG